MTLQDVQDGRNAHNMLIVTGDVNAEDGEYNRVMGRHRMGSRMMGNITG